MKTGLLILLITPWLLACSHKDNPQVANRTANPCVHIEHQLGEDNPSLNASTPARSAAYRSQLIRTYQQYDCSDNGGK